MTMQTANTPLTVGVAAGAQGAPRLGAAGSWRTVWLIARREITTRMATRSFRIMTAVLVLAALGGVLLGGHFAGTARPLQVAVSDPAQAALLTATTRAAGMNVEVTEAASPEAAKSALEEGNLAAFITPSADGQFGATVAETLDPGLKSLLDALNREAALSAQITALGGDPGTVAEVVAGATTQVTTLREPPATDMSQVIVGTLTGVVMMMALMLGAQMVAMGVVEEKASRVVEVLLSTVRPWQLMAGKALGIGLVTLAQLGLVVAVAAVAAQVTGLLVDVQLELGATLTWALVWFLVGYAIYSVLFAAVGALVSRQEEVSSVIMPFVMLMFIPYFIGISMLIPDPHNALASGMSLVPFFAPFLMPIRVALGVAPLWQQGVALLAALVLLPLLVALAGRIYRNAVLRTGARVHLKEALQAA